MKKNLIISGLVAGLLLSGCGSSNSNTNNTTSLNKLSGDSLAKTLVASSTDSSLGSDSQVLVSSANTQISDENYTYNYTQNGGVLATQRIDWDTAEAAKSNLITGTNEDEPGYVELAKPVPKVICDANKDLCLVYNITALSEDITVAVTPYLSVLSIPDGASFVTADGKTPILGLSADVSVQDSSGNKLSSAEAAAAVTLTAKIYYRGDDISTLPTGSDYTLYQIKDLGETTTGTALTLTNTNDTKLSSGYDLTGFYPYVVAKAASFTTKTGEVKLGTSSLINATIQVIDADGKTLTTTKTNSSGDYTYKLLESKTADSIKIYSDLLVDGVYTTTDISSPNITIDSENAQGNYSTYFTTAEQNIIKQYLGKKVYSNSYSNDTEALPTDTFVTLVKPATIFSNNYTGALKYVSSDVQTITGTAINSFLKGEEVTDAQSTVEDTDYTITKTDTKLTINLVKKYKDTVHNYNETSTLTITKNSNDTYSYSFSSSENNSYGTSSTEVESLIASWDAKNDIVDTNGNQIQTISDATAEASEKETSSYNEETSSTNETANYVVNVSKVGNDYIVSAVENLAFSSTSNYSSETNTVNGSLTTKAKFGFTLTDTSYTHTATANISAENFNYKSTSGGDTVVEFVNENLDVVKDATSVIINGIDATNWPETMTPPSVPVVAKIVK